MADQNASRTNVDRKSDRELVVSRSFDAPAHIVFKAWSTPELFQKWWVPKSFGMAVVSCEMDIRTGGSYRLVMKHPRMEQPMAFFGTYKDVTTPSRMQWTNEESPDGALTTVTFEEKDGRTLVTLTDLYPSKQALDDAMASGATSGFDEQFGQLDVLLKA